MLYPFSDIPLKIDDQIGYAEGHIYIDYTCLRDGGEWEVYFAFDQINDIEIYDAHGNELKPGMETIYPQIIAVLKSETPAILERCYEHAIYD
jgi:hypothetical protein